MINFTLVIILIIAGFSALAIFIRHRTVLLKDQLDGRLTELLRVTKELAHAQGLAEGIAGEKLKRKE
jgi:hypothetical protein